MNVDVLFGCPPVGEHKEPESPPQSSSGQFQPISDLFGTSDRSPGNSDSDSLSAVSALFSSSPATVQSNRIFEKKNHLHKKETQLWNKVREKFFKSYTKEIPSLKRLETVDYIHQVKKITERDGFSPTPEQNNEQSIASIAQRMITQEMFRSYNILEIELSFLATELSEDEKVVLRRKHCFLPQDFISVEVSAHDQRYHFLYWETGHYTFAEKVGILQFPVESKRSSIKKGAFKKNRDNSPL